MSVYFVTCREVGMVKIGCAYNPRRRLETMQSGCPIELTLEAMLKGSYSEEKELHARFAHLRMRGEWFRISPEINEIIAANPPPVTQSQSASWPLYLKRAREMQGKRTSDPDAGADAKRYAAAMAEMQAEKNRLATLETVAA